MKEFHFTKQRGEENYQQYFQKLIGGTIIDDHLIAFNPELGEGEVFIYEDDQVRTVVLNYIAKTTFKIFLEPDDKYDFHIRCFPSDYIYKNKDTEIEIHSPFGRGFVFIKENDSLETIVREGELIQVIGLYSNKDRASKYMLELFQQIDKFSFDIGDNKLIRWKEYFFSHKSDSFNGSLYNEWAVFKLKELGVILRNIIIDHSKPENNNTYHSFEFDAVAEIKNRIDTDVNFKPNVKSLSKEYGLNPTKLSEVFKFTYGDTIYQYFKKSRIFRAKEMIENTDMSLSEIAYDLGYTDINHFSKSFRKEFGITPSALRNTLN